MNTVRYVHVYICTYTYSILHTHIQPSSDFDKAIIINTKEKVGHLCMTRLAVMLVAHASNLYPKILNQTSCQAF